MTLAHACKAERAEAMPYLERCREILGKKRPVDPMERAWFDMTRRERAFWMRAAGVNRLLSGDWESRQCALVHQDMTDEEWGAVRALLIRSADRAAKLAGGA